MYKIVVVVNVLGVFVIVDGGIFNLGYIVKVFLLGVLIVMMGSFLVGIDEVFGSFFY